MKNKISFNTLLASLAIIALAYLPMCSGSNPTPLPDSIEPGDGGQISIETPEVQFYPQNGRTNVVTTTNIELYFSVDMDQDNDWKVVINGTEYNRYTLSGITWERRALSVMPVAPFAQGSIVTVAVEGFVSTEGVSMPVRTVTFSIVQYDAPIVMITPLDGATGVIPASQVKLDFNIPVVDDGWTVTIDGTVYTNASPEKSWSGNVLEINPPGYFSPGETISVTAQGFKTAYGSMAVPEKSVSFTIGTDFPSIVPGDADPLPITAPLRLIFDRVVNLACGVEDPNCDWVVVVDGNQYTRDSDDPGDIHWESSTELLINHTKTGTYLPRGTLTATASGFYDMDGYPFGNGIDPVPVTFYVKVQPIVSSYPQQDDTNVSINTNIIFTFDEPVSNGCVWKVEIDGVTYKENDAGTTWNGPSRTTLTIDTADFDPGMEVQVTADGFEAADGVAFNILNYTFTPTYIPVTGVTLDTTSLRIVKGNTAELVATMIPGNATNQVVSWSSTNPQVATVTTGGMVEAMEKGTAVITVTTDEGAYKASCRVMVVIPHFVAVGDVGLIIDSTDNGITWTPKSPPAGDWLHHIAQGKGRYVAVGNNGRRLISDDNGITWSDVNDAYRGDSKYSLHHIVYTGIEFIAVGGNGAFMRSADGTTWSYTTISTNDLTAIAFSTNNELVAVGSGVILQSTDWGVTWEPPISANYVHDITCGNKFVAVISDDPYVPIWSIDGKTWNNSSACATGALHGIASGNNTYVAVGGKGRIISSSNGDTWLQHVPASSDTLDDLRGITYGNGVFVAVGASWRITRSSAGNLDTWDDKCKGACGDPTKTYCHYRGICYGEDEPPDSMDFIVAGEPITVNDPIPSGITFPVGVDDNGDTDGDTVSDSDPTATIAYSYVVSETEVTYRQWKEVYDWATTDAGDGKRADGGELYHFANPGQQGCCATTTDLHPVTAIDWRDAMVWCNALTEYCNKDNVTKVECAYYTDADYTVPHRDSWKNGNYTSSLDASPGGIDNPYVNTSAGGFRLLTGDEWELAARFIIDTGSDGILADPGEYYPGNFASGADVQFDTVTAISDFDDDGVLETSADVAVFAAVFAEGTGTSPVRSRWPNAMGIYDMSGNVWEWCFNLSINPSAVSLGGRVRRGSGWNHAKDNLPLGDRYQGWGEPYIGAGDVGFRIVRTVSP